MRKPLRVILLSGILLTLVIGLVFWWETPRLVAVSPSEGATGVPAATSLRLTFSHSMQTATLTGRLSTDPASQGNYRWEGSTLVYTPSQTWPAGATVKVKLESGGIGAGLLSLALQQGKTWSFTIGEPRLAYLYPANAAANIYLISGSASEGVPLTAYPGGVSDFQVATNSSVIYYSTRDTGGGSTIYRLELGKVGSGTPQAGKIQAGKPEPLFSCPQEVCEAVAVSPDGKYMAFERTALPGTNGPGYPQVWILSLGADNSPGAAIPAPGQPRLATPDQPLDQTVQPSWSSAGLLSIYDTNAAAFIFIDPAGGERARFTNQTGQSGAWNPNGKEYVAPEITFPEVSATLTGLQPLASSDLISFNWQTMQTQNLTAGEDTEDAEPAFSPNGQILAFARKYLDAQHWTPGRQLWLRRMDTGEEQQLTNDPVYNHADFAWSAVGDQLAFVRFNQTAQTEPPEVWLINPSTGQSNRLIVGGYNPQWIP